MMNPLISIITISYNNEIGIENTIQSVISQRYKNIEYIIIDGNSSDRTVDIIKKYESYISYWISENDNGISDAFNKGILKSNGDWLIFMNSGDIFYSDDVLEDVVLSGILNCNLSLIYFGKAIKNNNRNQSYIFGDTFEKSEFKKRMTLCHQSTFFHIGYFNKYGLFDNNFKLTMDYELLLRSKKYDYIFFSQVISIMDAGGVSQTNPINVYKECLIAKLFHTDKSIMKIYMEFLYFVSIYRLLLILGKWKL